MILSLLLTVAANDTPAKPANEKPAKVRPELEPIIGRCYLKNRPVAPPKPVAPKPVNPADFAKIAKSLSGSMVSVCLNGHNIPRQAVGLRPFAWSASLQNSAQRYAQQLHYTNTFEHSNWPGVGENLYDGTGSCANANSMWLAERVLYRGQSVGSGNFAGYGHFTQMMWPSTSAVGCGIAGGTVVCHYSPPGNMLGVRLTRY